MARAPGLSVPAPAAVRTPGRLHGMPAMRDLRAALLVVTLFFPTGCSTDNDDAGLLVGAASDLAFALPELAVAFEQETGIRVRATLGSSGQLAQQVLQGAPLDVVLSADRAWVERLAAAGRVAPGGRAVYGYGRLVLVSAPHRAEPVAAMALLGDAGVGRVAIANPDHAPYGRAAREALQAAGVWDVVHDRLVIAENVRQTLQFVGTGNVDVAIAALALMREADARWTLVPEELHAPLVQEAAAVAGRDREEDAVRFVAFLGSDAARTILARYQFVLPERPAR